MTSLFLHFSKQNPRLKWRLRRRMNLHGLYESFIYGFEKWEGREGTLENQIKTVRRRKQKKWNLKWWLMTLNQIKTPMEVGAL